MTWALRVVTRCPAVSWTRSPLTGPARSQVCKNLFNFIRITQIYRRRIRQKRRQRSSLLFGRRTKMSLLKSYMNATIAFLATRMIWRIVFKRTSILGGWWFGVMCTRWSSTFPKHPFCQMSVLLIVHFFKSSCCQILVRHLQRRPFPSLLSDSSFMLNIREHDVFVSKVSLILQFFKKFVKAPLFNFCHLLMRLNKSTLKKYV